MTASGRARLSRCGDGSFSVWGRGSSMWGRGLLTPAGTSWVRSIPSERPLDQLFPPPYERSRMRVVTWRCDEPTADGILEQVSDDLPRRLGLSQDVIVIAALPQPPALPLLPFECASLLEQPDPLLKVA